MPNNLGVVTYFGASVVKIAGLQQACISEVLLIDNRGADIGVMIVQVLHDESFWLFIGALVILSKPFAVDSLLSTNSTFSLSRLLQPASASLTLGAIAFSTHCVLALFIGCWLIGSLVGPDGASLLKVSMLDFSFASTLRWLIETPAPGIITRKSVCEPLASGILALDSMVPVGRGQRELVVGDRQTGKTSIGLDTILNQHGLGVLYFLAGIGQKATVTLDTCLAIASRGAFGYATISMASASASAVSQFLCAYATSAMTEFSMWTQKSACFVFYDDLSKHAVAYRELSLLLRRPPGREAFPGEIFFVHSRVLERSCKLHFGLGGGSVTAFPVLETLASDVSGYITTNVISITDGQIFLSVDFFLSSIRPAVDVGLSVTRVGSAAQTSSMKKVGGAFKIDLAQYCELQAFSQFASDIGPETQLRLAKGIRLVALLTQCGGNPLSIQQQVRTLCLSN